MVFRLNRHLVVLLAVFLLGLGGVVHGYAAAIITAQMPIMAGSDTPASDDCGHCSSDADMPEMNAACQAVCTSPALIGSTFASSSMSADSHRQITLLGAQPGIAGPPDPHPPKPVSLS